MKLMIKSALVVFFGLFLMLASCAKKNNSSSNRGGTAPRGDQAAAATTNAMGIAKCSDGVTSADGRIFDDTMGTMFRTNWSNFFSAVMADNMLGDLSGSSTSNTTGVNVSIKLKIVNNQLSLNDTKLTMRVQDSLVGTTSADGGEVLKAIVVDFTQAIDGRLTNVSNGTGQFTVVFKDNYGQVTLSGSFNQTKAEGTVSFANSVHYNNETPKSGNLGKFSLNSCGLFY
tara:strand:- start:29382 stop:30065 length:684 start_codon:yes stop_codon:yes gene_type:complete